MGNSGSNTCEPEDSSESDYESTYTYHTAVFQHPHSEVSALESCNSRIPKQSLISASFSVSELNRTEEDGQGIENAHVDSNTGGSFSGMIDKQVKKNFAVKNDGNIKTTAQTAFGGSTVVNETLIKNENLMLHSTNIDINYKEPACSDSKITARSLNTDDYVTAKEEIAEDSQSDDDSISTITPPRITRPHSESEFSSGEDFSSESEEENAKKCSLQTKNSCSDHLSNQAKKLSPGVSIQKQTHRSSTSSRLSRKRHGSPVQTTKEPKMLAQCYDVRQEGLSGHYGYLESSDSESPEKSIALSPARTLRQTRSMSARNLQHVASQFVETSQRILQEAKSFAHVLRNSVPRKRGATKKISGNNTEVSEDSIFVKRRKMISSCGHDLSQSTGNIMVTRSKGQSLEKPMSVSKGESISTLLDNSFEQQNEINSFASSTSGQVRKNSGILRKFTHSADPIASISHLSQRVVPSASSSPFSNVQLIPSAVHSTGTPSNSSEDSISGELLSSNKSQSNVFSPFSQITSGGAEAKDLPSLSQRTGSVWTRFNTLNSLESPSTSQNLPYGIKESGISTQVSPSAVEMVASNTYPPHSTPLVPSLTLTGQFSQSGHFAFLLEDVLQVTVETGDMSKTATSVIVCPTDSQLQHKDALACTISRAVGPRLFQACQQFIQEHGRGLKLCEVLDTPADGKLSSVTSHILLVTLPDANSEQEDFVQHKKLLLCTYVNCMKFVADKLKLGSVAFPLFGAGYISADLCIQIFFDSLLIYLAECGDSSPLHGIYLVLNGAAIAQFSAEIFEARLETMIMNGVDDVLAGIFQEYFGILNFNKHETKPATPLSLTGERSPTGKPPIKRRRL